MLYIAILLLSYLSFFLLPYFEYKDNILERNTLSYYNKLEILINSSYYNKCLSDCIGIEMEIEFNKEKPNLKKWENFLNTQVYDNFKWADIFFIKYDYTIPYGIEINFQPLKFDDFEKINWKPFFNLLIEEKGYTHIDTGLHLHLPYLPEKNVYQILEFLILNKDEIIKFMKRNNISYSRFCSLDVFKNDYNRCIGKLFVLNINKSVKTIEVRGFKMTLNQTELVNYVTFMRNLDKISLIKN